MRYSDRLTGGDTVLQYHIVFLKAGKKEPSKHSVLEGLLVKDMNSRNQKVQLTLEGFNALKSELEELVNIKRPKLVDRLSYARSQGDLSENNDYSNAKEELEFLDGRIDELEYVIENACVVKNGNGKKGRVDIGTKVTLKVNNKQHVYEIVGEWESDPLNKKISPESPLGKALHGKKVGENAVVEAPAGQITYEILAVE